jgi:hypothetical protein
MTAEAQTTSTVTAARSRRHDTGTVRLSQRDIDGLLGLLSPARYATVVYLTAPAARSAVLGAVASLPAADQPRVAVRDLPATAFNPKRPR